MSVRPSLTRPLCNRVTPFGEIVRHPARGMLMGNRGCLHDEQGGIVRGPTMRGWISCAVPLYGNKRDMMAPGQYTELFFLDEPTALAVGHRPCGYCRPEALRAFKEGWAKAHGLARLPRVAEMDSVLRRPANPYDGDIADLPDGAMIAAGRKPLLRWRGTWLPWSLVGYGVPVERGALDTVTVVTAAPMIAVIRVGYRPIVHESASTAFSNYRSKA